MPPNRPLPPADQATLAPLHGTGDLVAMTVRLPAGTVEILRALGQPSGQSAPQQAATLLSEYTYDTVRPTRNLTSALNTTGDRLLELFRAHGMSLYSATKALQLPLEHFVQPGRLLASLQDKDLEVLSGRFATTPDYILGVTPGSGLPARIPAPSLEAILIKLDDFLGPDPTFVIYGSSQKRGLLICVRHQDTSWWTEQPMVYLQHSDPATTLAWLAAIQVRVARANRGRTRPPLYREVSRDDLLPAMASGALHPLLAEARPLDARQDEHRRIGADPNGYTPATLYAAIDTMMAALPEHAHHLVDLPELTDTLNVPPRRA